MIKIGIAAHPEIMTTLTPILKRYETRAYPFETMKECLVAHRIEKFDCILAQEEFAENLGEGFADQVFSISTDATLLVVLKKRDSARALHWMEHQVHECLYEPLNPEECNAVFKRISRSSFSNSFIGFSLFKKMAQPLRSWSGRISGRWYWLVLAILAVWGGLMKYQNPAPV